MIAKSALIGIILFVAFASLSFGETTYYDANNNIVSESAWNITKKRWDEIVKQRNVALQKEKSSKSKNVGPNKSNNTDSNLDKTNQTQYAVASNQPIAKQGQVADNSFRVELAPSDSTIAPSPTVAKAPLIDNKPPTKSVGSPAIALPASLPAYNPNSRHGNVSPSVTGIDWAKITGKALARTIAGVIVFGIITLVMAFKKKRKKQLINLDELSEKLRAKQSAI